MRIEEDMKLDFKDVLIRPKRSTLGSRKEVDLSRGYTFRNYKPEFPENVGYRHWRGVPSWQVTWTVLVHLKWQIN